MSTTWDYDNRTGRPPGRLVRGLGTVVRGVAQVQAQVGPCADTWRDHNHEVLARPPRRRRWVVLGDSMSQGVGASTPRSGLVDQVLARLRDAGHALDVVNLSATGARVPDVVEQQLPLLPSLPATPDDVGPDLVTALIGSNDLFGGRRHRAALPAAMAELVDGLPRGAVVATLPQPRAAARQANTHLDRAAAQGRITLVDLRVDGPTSWRGRLAPDWFHPNDAGYAAMADAFVPVLLTALRSGRESGTRGPAPGT